MTGFHDPGPGRVLGGHRVRLPELAQRLEAAFDRTGRGGVAGRGLGHGETLTAL